MKIFDRKFSPEFIEKLKRAIEKDFRNFPPKYTLSLWNNNKEIVIKLKESLFKRNVKHTEEDQKMFGHFYVSIEFGNFGPRVCLRESIESLKFFYDKKNIEFISTPSNEIKDSKALVDTFTFFIERSIEERPTKEKPTAKKVSLEKGDLKEKTQEEEAQKEKARKESESKNSNNKVSISYNQKFTSSRKRIRYNSWEGENDNTLTLKLFGGNIYIDTKYFFMHHAYFTEIFMAYETVEKTIKEEYPSVLDRIVNWFKT